MQNRKIRCEEFDQLNFETSFRIYQDSAIEEIDKSQLKNFVMSVAEL
jgi:uncharacterized protein YggL (DUF469 family)